jgi:tetratricopeptide (TPR) repeat protein
MPRTKSKNDDPYSRGLALAREGRHADAIPCFEAALLQHPQDARVYFALGNTADAIGHHEAAENFFRRVLVQQPGCLEALVNLANLLRRNGRTTDAIALLKPAIERTPNISELWLTLGSAMREAGDSATAEIFYSEALRLAPNNAAALGNLADLLADQGRVDEGLALYEHAIAIQPKNAQARLNRALLLLHKGDLTQGWADYEYRLKIPAQAIKTNHHLPQWSGDIRNMALLVTAEQGLGDQIMFASLIPKLAEMLSRAGGRVGLEAEPRLVPLFARSFAGVIVHASHMEKRGGTNFAFYDWLDRTGGADAAIALGSLPHRLCQSLAELPQARAYLSPEKSDADDWSEWLHQAGEPPYIGLCWRSGNVAGLRAIQYAPLASWADFAKSVRGSLVSLQYDAKPDEIEAFERWSGRELVVAPGLDQKQEIDRTAALMANLDAVVSAPTAVSWTSAALGVPTLKILYKAAWTALGLDYEPFAPACRCIMPQTGGDWPAAFRKAASTLERLPAIRDRCT